MDVSSQAIGVFDSGVGGLTMMKELMKALPHERFIYLGDTARVPYGNKSKETVIRYSIEGALALIQKNIKLLVIACHTASALALDPLQELFQLPIVGIIHPSAKRAVEISYNQRIAVLGTRATIGSGAYQEVIHKFSPTATIIPIACPLFVPLVEEGWFDHPATKLIIQEYLHPLIPKKPDTLILACTHYPFLQEQIEKEIGKETIIVDPATACVDEVALLLEKHQLLSSSLVGEHEYFVSDDPKQFCLSAQKIFGEPIYAATLIFDGPV